MTGVLGSKSPLATEERLDASATKSSSVWDNSTGNARTPQQAASSANLFWSPSIPVERNTDPRFIMPKCDLPPSKEFHPVENFVSKAVTEQHQQGSDATPLHSYKGILDGLRAKNDLELLRKILLAMRTSRNTLSLLTTTKHARLIHQLFRFDPFQNKTKNLEEDGDEIMIELVDAHLSLIVAIVSANSIFLVPAITALWKLLARYQSAAEAAQQREQRLHAAMATIVRLCPKTRTELFPVMASNCPFRTRPEEELTWYYRQCLFVINYIPGIESRVVELLVEKCLEMDVEIKINDGGKVSIDCHDDDSAAVETIFELEMEEDKKGRDKVPVGTTVDEMADKLDSLMLIVFQFVEEKLKKNPQAVSDLFQIFSRAFDASVLITHKSKFVQFLMLNVCGMDSLQPDPELLYREFAANLINVILDPYKATVTRQSGACYLASFVSRASFVCPETVCETVSALLRWAEAYIGSLGSTAIYAPDARDQGNFHSLFYTVCQSAFYIMCFRGVEAVEFHREALSRSGTDAYEEPSQIDITRSRWTKLCSHPLQPLRWCLATVRSEFLEVSRIFDLLDDSVLTKLNSEQSTVSRAAKVQRRRASLISTPATMEKERQSGGVGGLGRGGNPLDSFFPFDPYLLHRSSKFVEPYYVHWNGSIADRSTEFAENEEIDAENLTVQDAESGTENETDDTDSDDDSNEKRQKEDGFRPMSLAYSDDDSVSSASTAPNGVSVDKESMRSAFSTLKRPRAPSIENGSW